MMRKLRDLFHRHRPPKLPDATPTNSTADELAEAWQQHQELQQRVARIEWLRRQKAMVDRQDRA